MYNMKRKLFTAALTTLLFSGMAVSAQGIYENDLTIDHGDDEDYTGNLRAITEDSGGGGGEQPGENDPIGEGILILSALAGGYALVKKRSSKKESNL
ncbi:hypothetical protein FACS189423_10230 [Bacteroidia bacterium]|nr:hypothetical protein FACS189423_10230 [Bacteroidia bacterium]